MMWFLLPIFVLSHMIKEFVAFVNILIHTQHNMHDIFVKILNKNICGFCKHPKFVLPV